MSVTCDACNERMVTPDAARIAPRRREGLACHELDDEAVLFDNAFTNTYRLNATAYRVWRLCDGGRTVGAIARELTNHYAVTKSQALADVVRAIDEMASVGLVVAGTDDAT